MTTPSPDQSGAWQRSITRRFLKWLFSWRTARRLLISLACIVTLLALFYAEENIRGKHAWDKYRQKLEGRGEQLDLAAFIPKAVPDDQNFAATPLIKSWFVHSNYVFKEVWKGDNYQQAQGHVAAPKSRPDTYTRQFLDLAAWGKAFDVVRAGKMTGWQKFASDKLDLESRAKAAPPVLEGLKTGDVMFAELRTAGQRPYSRYPVQYGLEDPWGILLPHLNKVKGACLRLQLKACAELATGQSEAALEDVKLIFRLADSVKDEPFIISYLVRIACLQMATQPIWEGLCEHRWNDAQLEELQTRLQRYDFVADLKLPLDCERAAGVLTVDLLLHGKYHLAQLANTDDPRVTAVDLVFRIMPRGWYYQEQLSYLRLYQVQLGGGIDTAKRTISPQQINFGANYLGRTMYGVGSAGDEFRALAIDHCVVASLLLPALSKLSVRAATAQTAADQAAIACALERYRLANGQFPQTLDALVPRFISQLPHDVINGESYNYRRTDDGQFVLYSVGWNEKDDGGVPGKTLFDDKQGDWVWQYPARQ